MAISTFQRKEEVVPKFIVLSGKKQAGKTTCANFIKTYINDVCPDLLVEITSFATPIKDFCSNILGLTEAQIFGNEADKNSLTSYLWDNMPQEIRERYEKFLPNHDLLSDLRMGGSASLGTTIDVRGPMTAREIMQVFGTDIMRNFFDKDIWAKVPFRKSWGNTDIVIIDDCRFPNEADSTLKNNGILIRLKRNPLQDTHVSEIAMDDYDESKYTYVIDNTLYKNLKYLDIDVCNILKHEEFTK